MHTPSNVGKAMGTAAAMMVRELCRDSDAYSLAISRYSHQEAQLARSCTLRRFCAVAEFVRRSASRGRDLRCRLLGVLAQVEVSRGRGIGVLRPHVSAEWDSGSSWTLRRRYVHMEARIDSW